MRKLGAAFFAGTTVLALTLWTGPAAITAGPVKSLGKTDSSGVSCPRGIAAGSSTCAVVGSANATPQGTYSVVTDGVPKALQTANPGGSAVDCVSTAACVVAGADATTGTLEWFVTGKAPVTIKVTGSNTLTAVACESTTVCVAVGSVYTATSETSVVAVVSRFAKTGTAVRVAGVVSLDGVACETSTKCLAVGTTTFNNTPTPSYGVVVPITNGQVGAKDLAKQSDQLATISCGTATSCWAIGFHESATTGVTDLILPVTNGHPGVTSKPLTEFGTALSCVSATTCYRASATSQYGHGEVYQLVNGVATAHLVITGFAYGTLTGISCPTSTACLVTGATSFHNPGVDYYYTSGVSTVKV